MNKEGRDVRGDGLLSVAEAVVVRRVTVIEPLLLGLEACVDDVLGIASGSRGRRGEDGDGEEELHSGVKEKRSNIKIKGVNGVVVGLRFWRRRTDW